MPDLIEMIVLKFLQVGGAPTQKLTESQLTIMCASWRGPNIENFKRNSTDNASWGSTK